MIKHRHNTGIEDIIWRHKTYQKWQVNQRTSRPFLSFILFECSSPNCQASTSISFSPPTSSSDQCHQTYSDYPNTPNSLHHSCHISTSSSPLSPLLISSCLSQFLNVPSSCTEPYLEMCRTSASLDATVTQTSPFQILTSTLLFLQLHQNDF